jgi:hypothetical protein
MSVLGNKPPEQLSAADIEGLVDARVPEGRLIDYKRELLLSSPRWPTRAAAISSSALPRNRGQPRRYYV